MDSKSSKERHIKRQKQIQSFSMWSEMGQDCTITYVFTERCLSPRGAQVVHHANVPTRQDDCISHTAMRSTFLL